MIDTDICMLVDNEVSYDSRVIKEATSLTNCGYRVVVVGFSYERDLPTEETLNGFTILRSVIPNNRFVKIRDKIFLQMATYSVALIYNMLSFDNSLINILKKGLLTVFRYTSRHWQAPGSAAIQAVRAVNARVYHAHDYPALVAMHHAHSDKPIIYDSHELYFDRAQIHPSLTIQHLVRRKHIVERQVERNLARRSVLAITVCDSIADRLRDTLGISRPTILRNAVDMRMNGPQSVVYDTGGRRILAHTGHFALDRHLEELISALKLLPEDLALVLMGKGPLENRLKIIAQQNGTANRLFFVPPVPPHCVVPTLAQSDAALVLTSRTPGLNGEYALPNKLFEAIAAGIPIVSGPNTEIAAVMRNRDIGVICDDPTKPEAIAAAVTQLLQPENYARYKANAIKAREVLNWEQEEKKLITLYQRLMKD